MSLKEQNKVVENEFSRCIEEYGLTGKLEMDPIPNICKRRQHYSIHEDGTCVFTAYMWQLNKLSDEELKAEVEVRVRTAAKYFHLI